MGFTLRSSNTAMENEAFINDLLKNISIQFGDFPWPCLIIPEGIEAIKKSVLWICSATKWGHLGSIYSKPGGWGGCVCRWVRSYRVSGLRDWNRANQPSPAMNPPTDTSHVTYCWLLSSQQVAGFHLVGGWAYPSKKIWVRHLGWWNSQLFLDTQNSCSSHHQPDPDHPFTQENTGM